MAKSFNKVLVLGGAGFIGSHLVRTLVDKGYQVTVIDNLSRGDLAPLKDIKDKFSFLKKDLRVEKGLLALFEEHDLVFNLAALNTGVDYDEGRTQLMFEENMLLQLIPLRVAAKTKSVKRFIQLSSAVVYSREAMNELQYISETDDTSNPEESKLGYALAKKMGENLAIWYAENSNLETVITRFNNVYGEDDHFDQLGHFIPVMTRKIIKAKDEIQVFGSGQQSRSFIYVGDVVKALLFLAKNGKNGEIYNVDSACEKKVATVVEEIRDYLGRNDLKIYFDLSKPEGSKRRMLNTNKLKSLGWEAKTSFEEGLKKTIDNIQQRIASETS